MSVCNESNPHTNHLAGAVKSTQLGMSEALDNARAFASAVALNELTRYQFLIVVEELMTNIISHGQPAQTSMVEYEFTYRDGAVRIHLTDGGVPFDPRELSVRAADVDQGREGGWGWPVILKWCKLLAYRHEDGRNHLDLLLESKE